MRKTMILLITACAVSVGMAGFINGLPADGLVAWFDASDLTGLSNGDPVTLWQKKAGIADVNDLEDWNDADSYAPTYVESSPIFGNKPCISFAEPRYQDYLVSQNLIADNLAGKSLTYFIVSQGDYHGAWNAASPRLYFQGHRITLGTATQFYCTVGYPSDKTTSAIRTYTIDVPNKEVKGWLDGVLKETADLSGMPDSDFLYGATSGFRTGAMHAGFTAEIIIYNRMLDAVEINVIGYYLANKYNIAGTSFIEPGPVRTLTVSVNPSVVDTITPAAGQYEFLDGQVINLNAPYYLDCPDVYEFSNWVGDVNDITDRQTFVLMDADQSVTANYVPSSKQCVTLSIETVPAGVTAVTPAEGSYQYPEGYEVSLNTVAHYINCPQMYDFVAWSSNVDEPLASATSITLNSSQTVTATFSDFSVCGDECHPYPQWDKNQNCEVDEYEFQMLIGSWLECSDPICD